MDTTQTNTVITEGKNIAIVSYITVIGLVIAFVMNNDKKNEFAKYHIKQSLGLALTGVAMGAIGLIPILGWLVNIVGFFVLLYMWVVGLLNAINGKEKAVPFLGSKYEAWFHNL
ncbi:hypothetical protein KO566_12845 [Flavobacteriaceae bacterium XHP0103]|uniref:DUF4870 domain-containing protein n=1 Tax=Marixanthotalea marina TaxID=2844359 RepID=UPI00298A07BA|nr:hypothetical protein [Marixanthotalea marina]MBU3822951.1 hypothetical protein [Marixanthotalea marina]